jgi:hypothetical protein
MGCCIRTGAHLTLDLPKIFWKKVINIQNYEVEKTKKIKKIARRSRHSLRRSRRSWSSPQHTDKLYRKLQWRGLHWFWLDSTADRSQCSWTARTRCRYTSSVHRQTCLPAAPYSLPYWRRRYLDRSHKTRNFLCNTSAASKFRHCKHFADVGLWQETRRYWASKTQHTLLWRS